MVAQDTRFENPYRTTARLAAVTAAETDDERRAAAAINTACGLCSYGLLTKLRATSDARERAQIFETALKQCSDGSASVIAVWLQVASEAAAGPGDLARVTAWATVLNADGDKYILQRFAFNMSAEWHATIADNAQKWFERAPNDTGQEVRELLVAANAPARDDIVAAASAAIAANDARLGDLRIAAMSLGVRVP